MNESQEAQFLEIAQVAIGDAETLDVDFGVFVDGLEIIRDVITERWREAKQELRL